MRDDVVTVSESDYKRESDKFFTMACEDKMVVITADNDGRTLLVMGLGAPKPQTEEEKAEEARSLEEFFAELEAADGERDPNEPLNSWLE